VQISFAHWQTVLNGWQTAFSKRQMQHAEKNLEPEDVWLRFFLRRLRLALRSAKSPATVTILKELVAVAEERLDKIERAADEGRDTG